MNDLFRVIACVAATCIILVLSNFMIGEDATLNLLWFIRHALIFFAVLMVLGLAGFVVLRVMRHALAQIRLRMGVWRLWVGGVADFLPTRRSKSERWGEQPAVNPIGCRDEQVQGYICYTEHFAADVTTLQHLAALPDEHSRIIYAGFSLGYLASRVGEPFEVETLSGDAPRHIADHVHPRAILGWLASIQQSYPDNAWPDSRFVVSALKSRCHDYGLGRSYRLQVAMQRMPGGARQDKLEKRRDIPLERSREILNWSVNLGRDLAMRQEASLRARGL